MRMSWRHVYNSYRRHVGGIYIYVSAVLRPQLTRACASLCEEFYTSRNTRLATNLGVIIFVFLHLTHSFCIICPIMVAWFYAQLNEVTLPYVLRVTLATVTNFKQHSISPLHNLLAELLCVRAGLAEVSASQVSAIDCLMVCQKQHTSWDLQYKEWQRCKSHIIDKLPK